MPQTQHKMRYQTVLEMHAFGVEVMRQNLRRRHPDASEESICLRLADWLKRQPEWDGYVTSSRFH